MARVLLVGLQDKVGIMVDPLRRYPAITEVVIAETVGAAEAYLEFGLFDLYIIATFEFEWRKKGRNPPGLVLADTICGRFEEPKIILISDNRIDWPEFARMYPWTKRFFVFVVPYDDLRLETEACRRFLGIESRDYGLEEDEPDHSILVPPWTEKDAIDFVSNSVSF